MRGLLVSIIACVMALASSPVLARSAQPRVVSADPVDWTPHVLDGTVYAVALAGDVVVAGGEFSKVQPAGGGPAVQRRNLVAFRLGSGEILPAFAPRTDGPVLALASPGDGTVYIGGEFHVVNNMEPRRGLARLRLSDGAILTDFQATISGGDVRALELYRDWLYVGGAFRAIGGVAQSAFARVDRFSGRADTGFGLDLTTVEGADLKVLDFALSAADGRLAFIGSFTRVAGARRHHIAIADVSGPAAHLLPWATDSYVRKCHSDFDVYLREVDFSPDGDYLVAVSSGRRWDLDGMCDTAARFEARGGAGQLPTWINHTGGDSLYAVAATSDAVYVGGHQRFLNRPLIHQGVVTRDKAPRQGIAALDPITGAVLGWNPGRSRGVGVQAFLLWAEGLLVAGDGDQLGNEYHGRIGAFPQ